MRVCVCVCLCVPIMPVYPVVVDRLSDWRAGEMTRFATTAAPGQMASRYRPAAVSTTITILLFWHCPVKTEPNWTLPLLSESDCSEDPIGSEIAMPICLCRNRSRSFLVPGSPACVSQWPPPALGLGRSLSVGEGD